MTKKRLSAIFTYFFINLFLLSCGGGEDGTPSKTISSAFVTSSLSSYESTRASSSHHSVLSSYSSFDASLIAFSSSSIASYSTSSNKIMSSAFSENVNFPLAKGDFTNTSMNKAVSYDVLENDIPASSLTIISLDSSPKVGEFKIVDKSKISYMPAANFEGVESVEYTAVNPLGVTTSARFTVRVHPAVEKIRAVNLNDAVSGSVSSRLVTHVKDISIDGLSTFFAALPVGDVNRDGRADVLLGVREGGDIDGRNRDFLFNLWGTMSPSFGSSISLTELLPTNGSDGSRGQLLHIDINQLQNVQPNQNVDVDGDGQKDIVLITNTAVVIYFGGSAIVPSVNLNREAVVFSLLFSTTPLLKAVEIFDVNGDGLDDIVVLASSLSGSGGPQIKVFYGPLLPTQTTRLQETIEPGKGFTLEGFDDDQGLSPLALSHGDLNGDGKQDLIIGEAARNILNTTGMGQVNVVWGGRVTETTLNVNAIKNQSMVESGSSSWGSVLAFAGTDSLAIGALVSSGDVNGDGFDDLLIGAKSRSQLAPYYVGVYTVYGRSEWLPEIDITSLGTTHLNQVTPKQLQDVGALAEFITGILLADINKDGFSDTVIKTTDKVSVVLGGTPLRPAVVALEDPSVNWPIVNLSVGAGLVAMTKVDINNDGFDDLVIPRNILSFHDAFIVYGGFQYDF